MALPLSAPPLQSLVGERPSLSLFRLLLVFDFQLESVLVLYFVTTENTLPIRFVLRCSVLFSLTWPSCWSLWAGCCNELPLEWRKYNRDNHSAVIVLGYSHTLSIRQ